MSNIVPDGPVVPSTPTPVPASVVLAILKLVVVGAGLAGVTLPAAFSDAGSIQTLAGAVALVIGTGWQVIDVFRHKQAVHAAATASASAGRPVQPV